MFCVHGTPLSNALAHIPPSYVRDSKDERRVSARDPRGIGSQLVIVRTALEP
jgi:hypothetical protein